MFRIVIKVDTNQSNLHSSGTGGSMKTTKKKTSKKKHGPEVNY
jgi:hypothetical protein